jgi:hypothetical protein
MKFYVIFVIFFIGISTINASDDEKKELNKKLQIGIKKRVEDCKIKSKKGDVLHM